MGPFSFAARVCGCIAYFAMLVVGQSNIQVCTMWTEHWMPQSQSVNDIVVHCGNMHIIALSYCPYGWKDLSHIAWAPLKVTLGISTKDLPHLIHLLADPY